MQLGVLHTVIKEWKNLLFSPKRFFYTLVFPLLIFGFLSVIVSKSTPRDLPLAYVDNDQTQLSAQIIRMLDATPSGKMAMQATSVSEAQKWIQQQKVYGFVEIPTDFQKHILQGKSEEVICYTNNQYILPAGLIQRDFQQTIGTLSAGISMKRKMQKGEQPQKAQSEILPIRVDEHTLFNPYSNYAYYLLTALLPMMFQMVVMMVTMYVIGVEFKYNQGKHWLAENRGHPLQALFTKLLPYSVVLFFVGWWMNYFLFYRIGVPLQVPFASVLLMTILLVAVYQVVAILLVSILPDFRTTLTIGSGFTAIAFSFAAYTFPIEGIPTSMQYLAAIFPFTHFMEYFVNRAVKGVSVVHTWQPMVALLVYLLLIFVAYPLFVKRIKKGGYA